MENQEWQATSRKPLAAPPWMKTDIKKRHVAEPEAQGVKDKGPAAGRGKAPQKKNTAVWFQAPTAPNRPSQGGGVLKDTGLTSRHLTPLGLISLAPLSRCFAQSLFGKLWLSRMKSVHDAS